MPDPYFFVLGAPRSGTTFLTTLLDAHRRIRCAQELFVWRLEEKVRAAARDAADIGFEPAFAERWAEAMARAFTDQLVAVELGRTGKAIFGDKKPVYACHVDALAARFPQARFVHIVRDGRDVAASMLAQQAVDPRWRDAPWAPRTPAEAARQWAEHVSLARASAAQLAQGRWFELRYEALMATPEAVAAELFGFLGESPDRGARRVLAGARPRSRGWQRTLDAAAIAAFHAVPEAAALLAELGYPPGPAPSRSSASLARPESAPA